MNRRALRLAHENPELRAMVIPLLREAAYYYRRREPKYTGFLGAKHEQAIAKGYIDAGLVDPDFVDKHPRKFLSAITSNFPGWTLREKGVAFIRDPEDLGVKAAGSESAFIAHLLKRLPWIVSEDLDEEIMYADEREDWESGRSAALLADAVRKATFKATPIQGRTGKGYKVTMRPTLPEIQARLSR